MTREFLVALRTLVKQPGYAVSVVLTLAIGIAASTMMFSLVDATLLRPLPFASPERLLMLTGVAGPQRAPRGASFPEVGDWRSMNTTLDDVAIYDDISLNLRVDTEAIRVEAEMVSASYFPMLGASAALGRVFSRDEDAVPDRNAVAVVSDKLWRERLGSDPQILQRTVLLNDRPFQIVGVMPAKFAGVSFDTDVWIPSMMVSVNGSTARVTSRGTRWLLALGRLKPGVSVSRAQEDLTRVAAILERQYPDTNRERGVDVRSLRDNLMGGTAAQVRLLFEAVLLFLAVACANAAALQLVRATGRRRELAVRLALGARPAHVIRELVLESCLLSITAGAVGALAAAWSITAIVAWMPEGALPRQVQPVVDPRALAFAVAVSLGVGFVVALLPAFVALRGNLADAIRQGGRTLESSLGAIRRPSAQQLLVAAEIGAAVVLLTVAGLLVRSLDRQLRLDPGFDPQGVTAARVTLPSTRYGPEQRTIFVERLEASLRQLPGVRTAAIGNDLPLTGSASAGLMLPDTAKDDDGAVRYYRHMVTPEFFATLGMPIVNGRAFTPQDRRGGPLVAVINDKAAARIWGRENPVGRHFRIGSGTMVEVVGVVSTARYRNLTTDLAGSNVEPDVYFPYGQATDADLELAVRSTNGSPVPLVLLQQAVAQLDAGLPVYQAQPLVAALDQQTSTPRFVSALLTAFSVGALALAAIGLYGLVAYVVGRSRREIAIRMALGSDRFRVASLIVRNGMVVVAVGIALGGAASALAAKAIQTQLFQASSADAGTFVVVAVLLLVVAFGASILPTRRALTAEPHAALRD
jgi:predicted permease